MRVLFVEDEANIIRFVVQGLVEEGYAVDVATDGKEGLAYALAASYDLLLLDIMLPGMNGLDLLRELRRRGDKTPALMLTAPVTETFTVVASAVKANHTSRLLLGKQVGLMPESVALILV